MKFQDKYPTLWKCVKLIVIGNKVHLRSVPVELTKVLEKSTITISGYDRIETIAKTLIPWYQLEIMCKDPTLRHIDIPNTPEISLLREFISTVLDGKLREVFFVEKVNMNFKTHCPALYAYIKEVSTEVGFDLSDGNIDITEVCRRSHKSYSTYNNLEELVVSLPHTILTLCAQGVELPSSKLNTLYAFSDSIINGSLHDLFFTKEEEVLPPHIKYFNAIELRAYLKILVDSVTHQENFSSIVLVKSKGDDEKLPIFDMEIDKYSGITTPLYHGASYSNDVQESVYQIKNSTINKRLIIVNINDVSDTEYSHGDTFLKAVYKPETVDDDVFVYIVSEDYYEKQMKILLTNATILNDIESVEFDSMMLMDKFLYPLFCSLVKSRKFIAIDNTHSNATIYNHDSVGKLTFIPIPLIRYNKDKEKLDRLK